jgi:hypothetical protein
MTTSRALALVLLTSLAWGYFLHRAHAEIGRLRKDAATFAEDAEAATRLADATKQATDRAFAKVTADFDAHRLTLLADLADTKRLLRAEQAYSAAGDRQLARLAEQVAGKALWPTLAKDDVVVQFPKRVQR